MNLPNPVPSQDPGPDYATNLQSCFNIVDGHNHSVGSGNQINSNGILINADLPFNSNYNATLLRSVRFAAQVAPLSGVTDLGCLYESGVDLYYNDGNGNQVRITSGGNVNATSSGISSGTAAAAFVGSVLVVTSNTNIPANIKAGSILIGEPGVVSPNFVTLASATSLASSYSLALPTIPASQSFLTLDTSGNIAGYASINQGITRSNLAAVGQQISSSCGNFTYTSSTAGDITNLSVTITTSGRPVSLSLIPDGVSSGSPSVFIAPGGSTKLQVVFIRGSTEIGRTQVQAGSSGGISTSAEVPAAWNIIDPVAAGTYTYKVQAVSTNNAATVTVAYVKLCAYEL